MEILYNLGKLKCYFASFYPLILNIPFISVWYSLLALIICSWYFLCIISFYLYVISACGLYLLYRTVIHNTHISSMYYIKNKLYKMIITSIRCNNHFLFFQNVRFNYGMDISNRFLAMSMFVTCECEVLSIYFQTQNFIL